MVHLVATNQNRLEEPPELEHEHADPSEETEDALSNIVRGLSSISR